jgi:hypothetical protein
MPVSGHIATRMCMPQELPCTRALRSPMPWRMRFLLFLPHGDDASSWLPQLTNHPICLIVMDCYCRGVWRPRWWARRNATHSVTSTTSAAGVSAGQTLAPVGLLLPELAQLQWLRELVVECPIPIWGRLPAEWGLPGAFPRLQR